MSTSHRETFAGSSFRRPLREWYQMDGRLVGSHGHNCRRVLRISSLTDPKSSILVAEGKPTTNILLIALGTGENA